MTWLDVVVVGFTILMAVWGYSLGARTAAVLVLGFVGGGFLGAIVGPIVFDAGRASRVGPMFALTGALLFAAVLGALETLLRPRMRARPAGRFAGLEGPGGAALLVCLALSVVWLVGAVGQAGVSHSRSARPSAILVALDAVLPPAHPILHALGIRPLPPLARVDPVPQIKIEIPPRGPMPQIVTSAPTLGTPDPTIVRDPNVEAASRSVVRVVGTACGLEMRGSGWVARKGIVVTNAHVVAGQTRTSVELQDGSRHDAEVVRYEPRNDVAVLRSYGVSAAGLHPLTLRLSAPSGTSAAILGYPNGGPYRAVPARIGPTQTVLAPDSYGRGPFKRPVTALRGRVRRGDSGGPVIDADGRVVATTFLAALPRARIARTALATVTGFAVPTGLVRQALHQANGRVGTGPCAS